MANVSEMRKQNEAIASLLDELRRARDKMAARAPGKPAVELPLDKILTFTGTEGLSAVIGVEEIIYIADRILRDAAQLD